MKACLTYFLKAPEGTEVDLTSDKERCEWPGHKEPERV